MSAEPESHSCAPECAEHPFSSGYDWDPAIRAVTPPGGPYKPVPQPEGTVRVVLDSAGYEGDPARFQLYETFPVIPRAYAVFDVPRGQYERWEAALSAFMAMEEEIEALIEDRARNPRPAAPPGLPD